MRIKYIVLLAFIILIAFIGFRTISLFTEGRSYYFDHKLGATIEFWLAEDGKVAEIRLDDTNID